MPWTSEIQLSLAAKLLLAVQATAEWDQSLLVLVSTAPPRQLFRSTHEASQNPQQNLVAPLKLTRLLGPSVQCTGAGQAKEPIDRGLWSDQSACGVCVHSAPVVPCLQQLCSCPLSALSAAALAGQSFALDCQPCKTRVVWAWTDSNPHGHVYCPCPK